MRICSIGTNQNPTVQNINQNKNNITRADFKPKTVSEQLPGFAPISYYGSNISFGESESGVVLRYASKDQLEHLKRLVTKNPKILEAQNRTGNLLHNALCDCSARTPLMIRYLLSNTKIDINALNENGQTPLMVMINSNDYSDTYTEELEANIFNMFLNTGKLHLNIKEKDSGNTLLHLAIRHDHDTIAKKLLCIPELDINIQNNDGSTAFMNLCDKWRKTKLDVFKAFMAREDLDFNITDNDGEDAILIAESRANYAYVDKINEVLESRAKTEGEKRFNKNTLSPVNNIYTTEQISNEAARRIRSNDMEGLRELLDCTPLVDLGNESVVMIAAFASYNNDIMEMLYDYKNNKQAQMLEDYKKERQNFLENTMQKLDYSELKTKGVVMSTEDGFRLLMSKPEFHPNDMIGDSTLFEIAAEIDTDGSITKDILSKYGDVETSNVLEKTTNEKIRDAINVYEDGEKFRVMLGSIKQRLRNPATTRTALDDINAFFVNYGCRIRDEEGNDALLVTYMACDKNIKQIISDLLRQKDSFSLASVNNLGQNALMVGIESVKGKEDNKDAMNTVITNLNYLLDQGLNVNATDNQGKTIFHYICETKSPELLNWVLDSGVNVFLTDKQGHRGCKYIQTAEMNAIYNKFIND